MTTSPDRLRRQFHKLEAQKKELMDLLHPLSSDQYHRQPHSSSWSAGQAANHLYLSESLSMAYLRKKLSFPDQVPPFSARSILGVWVLRLYLLSPIKRKAPKAINMWDKQPVLSVEELDTSWTQLRSDMQTFFEENFIRFPHHLVYRHPFVGRLTLTQTLIFFNLHLQHHTRQIRKILKQIQ